MSEDLVVPVELPEGSVVIGSVLVVLHQHPDHTGSGITWVVPDQDLTPVEAITALELAKLEIFLSQKLGPQ